MKIQTVSDLLYDVHHDRERIRERMMLRRNLIIAAVALAFSIAMIAFGQTVEIYTEKGVLTNKPAMIGSPGQPNDYPNPNLSAVPSGLSPAGSPRNYGAARQSIAEIVAQMWARDELRVPWREPTPLPGNRDRK